MRRQYRAQVNIKPRNRMRLWRMREIERESISSPCARGSFCFNEHCNYESAHGSRAERIRGEEDVRRRGDLNEKLSGRPLSALVDIYSRSGGDGTLPVKSIGFDRRLKFRSCSIDSTILADV